MLSAFGLIACVLCYLASSLILNVLIQPLAFSEPVLISSGSQLCKQQSRGKDAPECRPEGNGLLSLPGGTICDLVV